MVPPEPPPATTKTLASLVPGCGVTVYVPVDVVDVTLSFPNEDLFVFPITHPFDEPTLFLGIVSSYADTQAVPFQSYTVGVSAVSSDFIASQPFVLSA